MEIHKFYRCLCKWISKGIDCFKQIACFQGYRLFQTDCVLPRVSSVSNRLRASKGIECFKQIACFQGYRLFQTDCVLPRVSSVSNRLRASKGIECFKQIALLLSEMKPHWMLLLHGVWQNL